MTSVGDDDLGGLAVLGLDRDEIEALSNLAPDEFAEYLHLMEQALEGTWLLTPKQELTEILWRKVDWMLYGGSAAGGKRLALSTRVPTPDGWTTMGALQVGSQVFTEKGDVCRVEQLHPVVESPPSYRVEFSDGQVVYADADHRWWTYTAQELSTLSKDAEWRARRRAARPSRATGNRSEAFTAAVAARNSRLAEAGPRWGGIRTTAEIAASISVGAAGRSNHVVPLADCVELPEIDLLVDPYVLGAWLGDGSAANGGITGIDPGVWGHVEAAGYVVTHAANRRSHYIRGLKVQLRELGVLDNKHVPPAYMRASRKQRLALLQGLMDTDGHACESGAVEFVNTNRQLAEAVVELACSLGHKARMTEGVARLNGRDCGPKYRVKWSAPDPVFRLERKLVRQRMEFRRNASYRTIIDCTPCVPVPMRCITVSNPTGIFLVENFIPTHNSEFACWHADQLSRSIPGHVTLILRQSIPELRRSLILRLIARVKQFKLPCRLRKVDGQTGFHYDNGSLIECGYLATDEHLGNYLSAEYDCVMIDEATQLTPDQIVGIAGRLRTTKKKAALGARPHLGMFTNPGDVSHAWMYDLIVVPTMYGARVVVYNIANGIENRVIARTYDAPVATRDATLDEIEDVLIPWARDLHVEVDPQTELAVAFIPSKATDNPHIDASYLKFLNALPERRRRQLRDGDWDVFEGQFFHEWDRNIHVIAPFDIPESWPRARGVDYGSTNPWACLWGAWDNDGNCYVYREAYAAMLTPEMQARQAKELSVVRRLDGTSFTEKYERTVADPSVFSEHRRGHGRSVAQMWAAEGFHVTKARNDRVAGWANVRQYLWDPQGGDEGRGAPRLYVFETCHNLARTLPLMRYDRLNGEDLDSRSEDHACLAPQTLVATRRGAIPISQVVQGDEVITRAGWRRVLLAGMTGIRPLVTIVLPGTAQVHCTPDHLVWTIGRGWVRADELTIEDKLLSASDRPVDVLAIMSSGFSDVWNLLVDGDPEFFAEGVLVHNCDALRYLLATRPIGERPRRHKTGQSIDQRFQQMMSRASKRKRGPSWT